MHDLPAVVAIVDPAALLRAAYMAAIPGALAAAAVFIRLLWR